jgi:hypothetical protein
MYRLSTFNVLKEIAYLNNKVIYIMYPEGYTSFDIMHYYSKILPRKQKKRLRTLMRKFRETNRNIV